LNSSLSGCRRWLLVGAAAFGVTTSVAAQAPASAAAEKASKPWHASGTLRAEGQANNNVFLLSDTLKARLDTLTAAAPPGTRFTDMRSASDVIALLQAGVDIEGPGLLGRTLSIRPTARYDYYARNPKRGNVELGLSIAQSVFHRGRLHLRGSLVPSYFFRNFLADAKDLNGNGTIESNERIYAAGTYHDRRVFVGYQQRLIRGTHIQPFGVAVGLDVGHVVRTYDAPLSYRSYRGPEVDASLAVDLSRAVRFDAGYAHASLNSTPDSAVLVLNEPDFGQDFNADGTATDLRVRTVQLVDFSRTEQDLNLRLRAQLGGDITARVYYQHRWRTFPSTQPFDVYNNSRRDRRDLVGLELSFRIAPAAQFSVGGDIETQKVTKSLIPAQVQLGEVADYKRTRVYAGLRYPF
jgi:hypothetical protein